jgi:hypothetical protein
MQLPHLQLTLIPEAEPPSTNSTSLMKPGESLPYSQQPTVEIIRDN